MDLAKRSKFFWDTWLEMIFKSALNILSTMTHGLYFAPWLLNILSDANCTVLFCFVFILPSEFCRNSRNIGQIEKHTFLEIPEMILKPSWNKQQYNGKFWREHLPEKIYLWDTLCVVSLCNIWKWKENEIYMPPQITDVSVAGIWWCAGPGPAHTNLQESVVNIPTQ